MHPIKHIAISALFLLTSCLSLTNAYAASVAGTITHLSGPLFAKKSDGTLKVLAEKSVVEQGDTVISEKETYASIKFIDNSEITVKPNSQLLIDSFSFEDAQPENDHVVGHRGLRHRNGARCSRGAVNSRVLHQADCR